MQNQQKVKIPYHYASTPKEDMDIILKICKERKIFNKFIEIGTWIGSTSYQIGFEFPEVQVYSFDITRHKGLIDVLENVHFFQCASSKILNKHYDLVKEADVVFIDADHSYRVVKLDFEIAIKIIKKDGIIVFHDHVYKKYGVKDLRNELLKNPNYKIESYNTTRGIFSLKNAIIKTIRQNITRNI
ncbi:MAG: class I SAM-dependent methyltransferase [bacterium]|nr:class I SAM-dependent methyltransferase [bacterium]